MNLRFYVILMHSSEIPFWLKPPNFEMSLFLFIPVSRRIKKFSMFCPLMWDVTSLYLTGSAVSLSNRKIWALPFWRINLKIHCFALCTCSPLESLYHTAVGLCFMYLKTGLTVTHACEHLPLHNNSFFLWEDKKNKKKKDMGEWKNISHNLHTV